VRKVGSALFFNHYSTMNIPTTHTLVVSFSGGRTSAYMANKIQKEYKGKKAFVFANTGKEREETLKFVERCDQAFRLNLSWIEAKVNEEKGVGTTYKTVDFRTAARNGEPFEAVIKKYGLPNKSAPLCTKELKGIPIKKWCQDNFGKNYVMAIGMRADERRREKSHPKKVYPLINWWPTWEVQIRNYWECMGFDLQLKDYEGNCDLCWKKSLRKRLTIISENPGIQQQWQQWEEQSEYVFDRDGYTIEQLTQMSKHPFRKSIDLHKLRFQQLDLFDEKMDLESSCFCST
jgi:hypothetical protein